MHCRVYFLHSWYSYLRTYTIQFQNVLTCSEETTVNVVNVVGGVGDYAFFPSCQFIILFYVIETILIRYTHLYKQLGNKTPMNWTHETLYSLIPFLPSISFSVSSVKSTSAREVTTLHLSVDNANVPSYWPSTQVSGKKLYSTDIWKLS